MHRIPATPAIRAGLWVATLVALMFYPERWMLIASIGISLIILTWPTRAEVYGDDAPPSSGGPIADTTSAIKTLAPRGGAPAAPAAVPAYLRRPKGNADGVGHDGAAATPQQRQAASRRRFFADGESDEEYLLRNQREAAWTD